MKKRKYFVSYAFKSPDWVPEISVGNDVVEMEYISDIKDVKEIQNSIIEKISKAIKCDWLVILNWQLFEKRPPKRK